MNWSCARTKPAFLVQFIYKLEQKFKVLLKVYIFCIQMIGGSLDLL